MHFPGPVSTEVGDPVRLQFPVWDIYLGICNQPPRSTQPGHPFVGGRNEYQPKGGVTPCVWGVKAGMVRV